MKARFSLSVVAFVLGLGLAAGQTYVGSDACKDCHEQTWNHFRVSGHPFKLQKAVDAKTWPLPLPAGYDWEDISYVIGGYGWKVRYLNSDGWIITDSDGQPGSNQYNLATGEWVDYSAGALKAYDCGSCHTTGYSADGHQGDLPGITGTWALDGIQCEACHGAASDHVALPMASNIEVDPAAELCGSCHVRGDPATIPAKGGFVEHHEQFNEFLASPHVALECSTCHDPHSKAEFSIVTECTTCHDGLADGEGFKKLGKRHLDRGVECIDCHMPYTGKSAVAESAWKGDVRSHAFRITLEKDAQMFDESGLFANGPIVPGFACLGCHVEVVGKYEELGKPEKAESWAFKSAKKIHK